MIQFRTISQLLKMFILPEVEKRVREGIIKEDDLPLELSQFRAIQKKLPDGKLENIVELNQEVRIVAKVDYKRQISPGEIVTLDDINPEKCFVRPPVYDGKSAAYFLGLSQFVDYLLFMDLRPNAPDFTEGQLEESELPFPIVDFINANHIREVIRPIEKIKVLSDNNWPPAPGYYPNVLLEMHKNPDVINNPEFTKIVSSAYGTKYWDERFAFWKETNFFPNRFPYLERALKAHLEKDYIASIYILVPQFEGIIRDYLIGCGETPKYHFNDKVKDLQKLIMSRKVLMFPRKVIETAFEYLETGSFWMPTETISEPKNIINRHGIAHGIFTGFECEEMSLKYLILLDSLSFILLHDKMLTKSL